MLPVRVYTPLTKSSIVLASIELAYDITRTEAAKESTCKSAKATSVALSRRLKRKMRWHA